jgi:hypothetical protein
MSDRLEASRQLLAGEKSWIATLPVVTFIAIRSGLTPYKGNGVSNVAGFFLGVKSGLNGPAIASCDPSTGRCQPRKIVGTTIAWDVVARK